MKPIKLIVSALIMFFVLSTNAQKIKFKKGNVLFDKVPVAKFYQDKQNFEFESLDNSNKISVAVKSINLSKEVIKQWIVVSDMNSDRTTQIEYKIISFSLSQKKILVDLLQKEYNIISVNGVENLDAFFSVERPNLEEQYKLQLKENENQAIANEQEMAKLNVVIDDSTNEILNGSEKIGSYVIPSKTGTVRNIYTLYDLDNKKIAIATLGSFSKVNVSLPYHKNELNFKTTTKYSPFGLSDKEDVVLIKEIVKNLAIKNVTLGHQIRDVKTARYTAKKEQQKEELEDFKKNSKNIYYTKGYIIDEKEGKREGEIQFIVEKPKTKSGIADLDEATLGQRVTLKYKNKKGKTRFDTFRSKSEEKFCIYTESNSERCFIGMRSKGKGLELAARGVSSLSFDTSYYYEIIKENENIGIYKDITYSSSYLVKLKKEKKALQFNTSNKNKNLDQIEEYFGGKIDANTIADFDFSNQEDVLKLLELYKN